MSAVIYCRVSTEGQKLEQQVSACRAGMPLGASQPVVISEKAPGWDFDGRKGYTRLCALVEAGKVDTLVVFKIDRLGRTAREVYDFVMKCNQKKTKVISVTEHLDFSTPLGQMLLFCVSTFAEMERNLISERTKAKFNYYRKKFHYKGHGSLAGWFSEKAIKKEPIVRGLAAMGLSAWTISDNTGLDLRTIKKMLAQPAGTLKTKKQLHQENPGWYKTPAQQEQEYKQNK